jgi:hypothetical protein
MLHDIKIGQVVRVWPRTGLRVLVDPQIPGRFLPDEGADVAWSPWWQSRASDGSVLLTSPLPPPKVATKGPAE